MPRFFLEIQYNGSLYHGWQAQPNAVSVQGVLDHALAKLLGHAVETVASGRTDTGVHCLRQYVHFDTERLDIIENLPFKLNAFLPQGIAVGHIRPVSPDTHARFDALSRSYQYHIHQEKNPFRHDWSWYYYRTLSLEAMQEACEVLKRCQHFEALSKAHSDVKTHECEIMEAYWEHPTPDRWVFHIKANRFLRGMVRLTVGKMVEVGSGQLSVADFEQFLWARERINQRNMAPAQGLYLCDVAYPEDTFLD